MLNRLENINQFNFLICLDCEFTCWTNSAELEWPDSEFPPEVIQIGLAVYDIPTLTLLEEFVSYISPRVNSVLSEYCKNLLNLTQDTIDNAKSFSVVADNIAIFLRSYRSLRALLCSFGPDWNKVNSDAIRHFVDDPFARFEKLDLRAEATRILEYDDETMDSLDRDWVYRKLNLPDCSNRHDALYDACDLARIVIALHTYQVSCQATMSNGEQTH